jgi:hypothetical protein
VSLSEDNVAKAFEDCCGTIQHLHNVHMYEQQLKEAEIVSIVHAKGTELSEIGI